MHQTRRPNLSTVRAANDSPESAVFLASPSKLVLVAMEHGFSAADAMALQAAQAAESARLSAWQVSL